MNISRNIHFTLLIKIGGRLREFNFRKRNPDLYDGDTSDERGTRIQFKFMRQEGGFEFESIVGLPSWVVDNKKVIAEAVEKEEVNW